MNKGFDIWRDKNGIPHIEGKTLEDTFRGQGYAHARDRGMQIVFMKILGQGRVSELLDGSDESLAIDTFFRKMNWSNHADENHSDYKPETQTLLRAYSDGVNLGLSEKFPWEFKLMGVAREEWTPKDCILISRMAGYLTLVQSQAEVERLFVELVQAGLPETYLEELFPGLLGGLDIELLKKVTLGERIIPPDRLWNLAIPRTMASNNWVVSGSKTASGKPIVANDPHLEINRLPNVWCEHVLRCGDRYMIGGTMPGFPGVLTGRNRDVAWGVTYAFVDSVDSWIEKCRDGACYREENDSWIAFKERKETIYRKKKEPVEVIFYENEHGTLDGDPNVEGLYLATRWAASKSGAQSFNSFLGMWHAENTDQAMNLFMKIESGWSFVLGDHHGDIGFQMSGHVPTRREGISGFVPLPGWKKENDWTGLVDPNELPRIKNPESGFFATANNDLNAYGTMKGVSAPSNMPMGSYRAERIGELLRNRTELTTKDMCAMHYDVFSLEAKEFMKILRPLLPDTEQGKILKEWDLHYDLQSKGAFLFECFYRELYREVFGVMGMGKDIFDFMAAETGVFVDFYHCFNRILLSEKSIWFNGRSQKDLFETIAEQALKVKPESWRKNRKFMLKHLLFGGKLPSFLGFDRGPMEGLGGRASIHQGQIYRSAGRDTTFMPSYRLVCDLSENALHTNIVGGPSDRRFSKWYVNDLVNWQSGVYKKIVQEHSKEDLGF